jgi:hypothetical protein
MADEIEKVIVGNMSWITTGATETAARIMVIVFARLGSVC